MKKNDGCQDLEGRENGEIQVKGYKILVVRINSEDLMYRIGIILDSTIFPK